MPSFSEWPESPLDSAQRAFDLLVHPPTTLEFDGCRFDGCPDRVMSLYELKRFLLDRGTSREVRDLVWREIVVRSRQDGPGWGLGAVGLAMPGLRALAGGLARGYRGDSDDIDAEILGTFWDRLMRRVDVDQPRILPRMLDAAGRAGLKVRYADVTTEPFDSEPPGPRTPLQPWDHPEFVLARAVAIGVIDADDANIIAETRLEGASVQVAAARWGIAGQLASHWRDRAESRLVDAIRDGELAHVRLRTSPAKPIRRTSLRAWPGQ
ncbi:hypothetical protein ACPXB5_29090 [Micromonospora arida]|uniref:hypothetical protein n=1 Tax=Micromonospora arida TaxID=2203715 RepID=UPI003CF9B110